MIITQEGEDNNQNALFLLYFASDTPHYENVPFEVPSSWVWCKLIDCCHIVGRIGFRGYTKEDLVNDGEGAITLSPSNIVNGLMNYDKCTFISWRKYEESPEIQVQSKDILLVKTGSSFGKCALIKHLPQKATINPQFVVLKHILINEEYLTGILQSNYARINYDSFVLGTAIPTFTQVVLGNMGIPLPPIEEQERIVAEIEKWFALIDQIEQKKGDLQATIKQTRNKILDLAIHGKLVPQNPADEPASELLKRINPNAEITCDNGQYGKIPKNWCACKLVDICSFLSRGKSPKYSEDDKTYPVFAQKCNLKDGGISLEQARFLDPSTINKWNNVYKLQTGDILVNSTGTGTVGRTRLFNTNCLGKYPFVVPDSHVSVIRVLKSICPQFIYAFISSNSIQQYMEENLAGSTNQKELYIGVLENMQIFLPPLAEQHRIVAKIEELFSSLDNIQKALEV